jgi:aryl-alcohol dehydrogenase-like predicted oxidoreductase
MEHRRLGRTGLAVSAIGLGTVELGLAYGLPDARGQRKPSRDEAARLLHQALDSGVNFIDTARAYGDSEEIIGGALKSRRQEYFLATKVGAGGDPKAGRAAWKQHLATSLHHSLRALQTDAIDLVQLHSVSAVDLRDGELAGILQEFQAAGKVRFLGATTYGEEAALAVLEDGRFDCIQIAYNALDRELESRVLPLAQAKDVAIVVRSVLLKGALTERRHYLPAGMEALQAAAESAAGLAAAAAMSLPELAYRFVLAHPAVSTALVGAASGEELQAAVEFGARGPLPPPVIAQVRNIAIGVRRQLNPANWPVP